MRSAQREPSAQSLEKAILKTVAYADLFDYPLTVSEIHRYLVGTSASLETVRDALDDGLLWRRLGRSRGYVTLPGRESLAETRVHREVLSARIWSKGVRYGRLIAVLPFVRMVAITGTLAVRNADPDADIDYLIVTAPHRVWLARSLCLILVYAGRLERITICPNYVISLHVLDQFARSLFTAHEIAQMIPVYGLDVYREIVRVNGWVRDYLPNAFENGTDPDARELGPVCALFKNTGEAVLGGSLGHRWEERERHIKVRRLTVQAESCGSSGATFTSEQCKGHMVDHASLIADAYQARLRQVGLDGRDADVPTLPGSA